MSRRNLPCLPSFLRSSLPPVLALTALAAVAAVAQSAPQPRQVHAHAPLNFELNLGQTSRQVQFLARTQGAVVFLSAQGMIVKTTHGAMNLQFAGASAHAAVAGEHPLATRVHYLSAGRDLAVPSFVAVRYTRIYPGVDVTYYGRNGQIEYDLQLAPHAAPAQLRLRVTGATVHLGPQGSLLLADGVSLRAPRAYQTIAGKKRAVSVRYRLGPDHSVGLALGAYDPSHALVVDPILDFSTFLGGTAYNQANAVAVDGSGNGYVAGYTLSADFPVVTPLQAALAPATFGTDYDAFVSEVSADGTALVYSTYLGGNGDDRATGIAVDAAGEAFVTGSTTSTNFPVAGAFQAANAGGKDAFIAKLNATGSALVYSSYLGGSSDDQANGIALDAAGEAFLVGTTASGDFPATAGAGQTAFGGKTDAFAVKVKADGSGLLYATYLGGTGLETGKTIAVDATGNAYVGGATSSTDFPATTGAWQTSLAGASDGFVAQVFPSGKFGYATYLGGSSADEVNGVAVDASGSAFAAGDTTSVNLFCPTSSCASTYAGGTDAFVAKLSNSGGSLLFGSFLGGSGLDIANAVVLDGRGGAYLAGYTTSGTTFPTTSNAIQPQPAGVQDAFLSKFDATGKNLLFSTFLGGSATDAANGLGINGSGALFVVGDTESGNFPVQPATTGGTVVQASLAGSDDAFVTKFVTAAQGVFSPTAVGFPAQAPSVASAAQPVTFSNGGELPLTITGITTTGPYTETDTCTGSGATLQPQQSCTINIVFKPTGLGAQNGTLVVADNGPGGSQTLALSGTGGDFSLTVAPTAITISAGSSASYALEVAPATGFTGVVALTCTGIGSQQNATCTASPTSLTMNGTTAAAATVTVTTTVRPAVLPWLPTLPAGPWFWLALAGFFLALLGLLYALRTQGMRRRLGWLGTAVLLGCSLAAAGCGGTATNPGTPAGNYTLTLTGTSGSSSHSQTVTLTVN